VPRSAGVQETLEHKFWFDELYDLIFYKPAVLLTRAFRRGVEEPLIGGSISGVTVGARETAGAVGGAQTGYLRSYALAIAAGVAILVVVFVSVQ
jgi:NADH-quinone oxidoreductase subunit L